MKQVSNNEILQCIIFGILVAILGFIFLGRAMDKDLDNRNTMLCSSALVSGDEEWLALCESYYKTGDITYLRSGR